MLLRSLIAAALLIACVGMPRAEARDAVDWTAPGWYIIWWVREDVAYDLVKGPFRNDTACNAARAKIKRHHADRRTLECRHLATSPP